jgi:hypothetical protein
VHLRLGLRLRRFGRRVLDHLGRLRERLDEDPVELSPRTRWRVRSREAS